MAKTDWTAIAAEYQRAHQTTGISAKDWCEQRNINYQSARRYLKTRGQSPAQPEKSRIAAQSAHKKVRKNAQSAQSAQSNASAHKTNGERGRSKSSQLDPAIEPQIAKNKTDSGREPDGRFAIGNRNAVGHSGNPHPSAGIQPGQRIALKHGGYAKYLGSPELFDSARELQLRDELDFTRARVLSVTSLLKGLQHDLATAPELEDRMALYDKILKAESALDRNIQRIESIERTISTLRVDDVSVPKIEADTRRIKAATRKLTAEADKLERDGGTDTTPISEIVGELQNIGTGGLMS